ncbi:hypothetical protein BJX61DRAFT_542180 [Aspergillus egyptiacus]|nr:hypothetical protein BJX61DRAFT_542180 [Aspergillus egyptiacus]
MLNRTGTELEGLRPIPRSRLDSRTDAEIIASLLSYHPVTSERNVWAFWDKGFGAMPPWTQRNLVGWVRRLGPSWTVRLVDSVPGSASNVYRYLEASDFPAAFNERRMNGKGAGQHASDFFRLAALYRFGGIYMDVTTILFRNLDDVCWAALEDPSSPYEVAGFAFQCRQDDWGQIMNCFIASRKKNPFIYRWHQIFLKLWEGRADATGIRHHPLVRHLGPLVLDDPGFGETPNWEGFSDYAAHILAYERVRLTREPGPDGFDGLAYFTKHFFLLDAWEEMCRDQDKFDGYEILKLLTLPRQPLFPTTGGEENGNGHPDDGKSQQRTAREFVHGLLAKSSVCKFSQGFWEPGMPVLVAALWNRPELADADSRPGTWGEYLRYGSVHLDQTGEQRRRLKPLVIPDNVGQVRTLGLFEVVDRG